MHSRTGIPDFKSGSIKNARTVRTAVKRIRKFSPKTPFDFAKIGVPLKTKAEGAGVFREAVRARDLSLCVKFPLCDGKMPASGNDDYHEGKWHTTTEVKRIERLRKFPFMRKYLPKIYYHDRKSGVLVMRWYEAFDNDFNAYCSLGNMAADLMYRLTGVKTIDIHGGNTRTSNPNRGEKGRTILIDMGY
jgi:hypothetical protein